MVKMIRTCWAVGTERDCGWTMLVSDRYSHRERRRNVEAGPRRMASGAGGKGLGKEGGKRAEAESVCVVCSGCEGEMKEAAGWFCGATTAESG